MIWWLHTFDVRKEGISEEDNTFSVDMVDDIQKPMKMAFIRSIFPVIVFSSRLLRIRIASLFFSYFIFLYWVLHLVLATSVVWSWPQQAFLFQFQLRWWEQSSRESSTRLLGQKQKCSTAYRIPTRQSSGPCQVGADTGFKNTTRWRQHAVCWRAPLQNRVSGKAYTVLRRRSKYLFGRVLNMIAISYIYYNKSARIRI